MTLKKQSIRQNMLIKANGKLIEKEELINSLGRPDLFEYLGSSNIDPEAEDCVFDYNKI